MIQGTHERREQSADVGARVENAGRERALLFWKPFGHGLDRGGKIAGLADAQGKTRESETRSGAATA